MKQQLIQIRQGDVQVQQVAAMPSGCVEEPSDGTRIVLAHGEVTGHAHAIYDHIAPMSPRAADEIAENTIARARAKARLWKAPNGERFLQVTEAVHLRHEEHTQHVILPGIYHLPVQAEYTPSELRRVAD